MSTCRPRGAPGISPAAPLRARLERRRSLALRRTAPPRPSSYQFRTHIYFIANNDKPGDGIPTLKRAELGPGAFTIVPLVEGVENLQLEYGLDTAVPTTGTPAVYTADPNTYNGCAARSPASVTGATPWR